MNTAAQIQVTPDLMIADDERPERRRPGPFMAICTDSCRSGCAVYSEASIQLVGDRKDSGDPYKGLDIIILRVAPEVVVVSAVQKKLIDFLEKRFKFKLIDTTKKQARRPTYTSAAIESSPMKSLTEGSQSRNTNPVPYQPFTEFSRQSLEPPPSVSDPAAAPPSPTLQPQVDDPDAVSEVTNCDFVLVVVPNIWFSVSKGLQKLLNSEFVTNKGLVDHEEKLLFLTSRVKKSVDVCAIRAVSALELYVEHTHYMAETGTVVNVLQTNVQLLTSGARDKQSDPNPTYDGSMSIMPILDVRYIDPGPVLSIDRETFKSLGIMFTKRLKNHNTNHAGFEIEPTISLFDILNQCQSLQGQRQLRTMMLWPLQDTNELNHRHDTVGYFMKSENRLFKEQLSLNLKSIVPLTMIISKMSQSVAAYRDLAKLYKALWSFTAILDLIRANPDHDIALLHRISNQDSPDFRAAIDSIAQVIDFEGSRQEKRVQVMEGISEEVDKKKEVIRNLTKFCDAVALEETSKYKDIFNKVCRVLYLPRIGFLCSINYTSTSELMSIRSNKEFDVLLHTEQSIYFKTERMESLDTNAGDIACDLIDIQESVVMSLQNDLLKHTEAILNMVEFCGELDCLITFATISSQRNYTRPEFTTPDREISIKEAYNPLYYRSQTLVPNDIQFYNGTAERKVKLMLITGPNSCGKTTYMKTTCLVVYMAHIGCFVPAKHAILPVVDAILTRLHTADSVSTGLSSFANDLHQINYALNRATENSLLVIDEFGKGTRARDGFLLLKGLVIYLAVRGAKSPHAMISTHFNHLVDHLQVHCEYISYKTFKVTRDAIKNSIEYDYKLQDGVGDVSLADQVAAKAGIPNEIIERAKQVRDHITEGQPIRPKPVNAA